MPIFHQTWLVLVMLTGCISHIRNKHVETWFQSYAALPNILPDLIDLPDRQVYIVGNLILSHNITHHHPIPGGIVNIMISQSVHTHTYTNQSYNELTCQLLFIESSSGGMVAIYNNQYPSWIWTIIPNTKNHNCSFILLSWYLGNPASWNTLQVLRQRL